MFMYCQARDQVFGTPGTPSGSCLRSAVSTLNLGALKILGAVSMVECYADGVAAGWKSPQQRVKWLNERRIFQRIRQRGPLSRVDLGDETGLSAQTVGVIVRRLLDSQVIVETGPTAHGKVGKQPIGLAINPEGALAVGCNIERDGADITLVDLAGQVRQETTLPFAAEMAAVSALHQIAKVVQSLLDQDPLHDKVIGLGIGTPGPIDPVSGAMVDPPHFAGWEGVAPGTILTQNLHLPVVVDNDATAAAVGEAWRLRGEQPTFLYCRWGVGIGGGLIRDAEVFPGLTGNVMELGHIVVNPQGTLCHCGAMGCLEAEASWWALMRTAALWGQTDVSDIAGLVASQSWVGSWFSRAANYLGQALTTAVNLMDVDRVVIGGYHFEQVQNWLLPTIQDWLAAYAFRRKVRPVQVQPSDLGEKAGAIGAATLVFQRWLPQTRDGGAMLGEETGGIRERVT